MLAIRRSPIHIPNDTTSPLRIDDSETESRAIVIGAGIAGLLAARALSEQYDNVWILERDALPDTPGPRSGIPQGYYVHQLLMRGKQTLEALFPGLGDELAQVGAVSLDWYSGVRWFGPVGWMPSDGEGFCTWSASRDLLEFVIRQRVLACPKVHLLSHCDVTGLTTNPSRERVTGVTVRARNGSASAAGLPPSLSAAFVVDASGRHSHAPAWLTAIGFDAPAETLVDAHVGYAGCLYRRPAQVPWRDWQALIVHSRPPECLRSGTIFPIEDNQWIVTLTGTAGDYPPGDPQGFLAFARSLRSGTLFEAIANAEPLTPIHQYRRTENRLRHYERLTRQPDGFVVMGDAACSFNPVYGQGMTVAAMSAVVLAAHGYIHPQPSTAALQRHLARIARGAWTFATGVDLRHIGAKHDRRHWRAAAMQRYVEHVLKGAVHDSNLYHRFLHVMHMIEPPSVLFSPSVIAQVARQWARTRWGSSRVGTAIDTGAHDKQIQ